MWTYTLRRVLYMVPIFIGITLVTFLLFNVVGDPIGQIAGKHATVEQIEEIKAQLGYDRPLLVRYFSFTKDILVGDFGVSWSTHQRVSTLLWSGVGASLSLTVPAFLLTLLITVSIALFQAHRRGSRIDRGIMVFCLAAMSISFLVYILFFQYWFGYQLGWFPISGWDQSWVGRWRYLSLPILIFVLLSLGSNILIYRTIFLDEMFQDYVRTAKAKGVGTKTLLFRHVLRNALIPIITIVVVQMPFLFVGSFLTEAFFSIPGIGGQLYQAIQNSDFPVIKAIVVISAILYMVFQLITDLLYAAVDPRVQLK